MHLATTYFGWIRVNVGISSAMKASPEIKQDKNKNRLQCMWCIARRGELLSFGLWFCEITGRGLCLYFKLVAWVQGLCISRYGDCELSGQTLVGMTVRDGQSPCLNIIGASRSGLWVIPWHYGNKYNQVSNIGNKASCPSFATACSLCFWQGHCFQAQRTRLWQAQMLHIFVYVHFFQAFPSFLPSFIFFLSNPKRSAGYWGT